MKLVNLLLWIASLLSVSLSTPIAQVPHAKDALHVLDERASTVAINGVPGAVYPRLEIRQMQSTQPNQWNLLLLALQSFQAQPQTNQLSFYQIAGIHGVPRVNWDGVAQGASSGGTDGYCTHDSVLFPAWHRAYMALFEQQFITVVNSIAASFTNPSQKAAMQSAAAKMRFPYWDWAAHPPSNGPNLPTSVSSSTITVTKPNGSTGTINNPLYRTDFTSSKDLVYYPFVNWPHTMRYPLGNDANTGSLEVNCTNAFNNIRASLQDQIFQMFSTCKDYLHFSNDDAGSSSTTCSNSLEAIHNTVHNNAGGGTSTISGGHMTYLAEAAFDPIFWLHHMNVDRLFAMWQTINPTQYGASQSAPHATWTIAQGSNQNADSPLTPFHRDTTGSFWTTNLVRNWSSTFHYTYPEFANSDGSASAINSYINKLYGPSATATAGSSKRTAIPDGIPAPAKAAPTDNPNPSPENLANPFLSKRASDVSRVANGSLMQYVANIKAPRYALDGSYNILIFLGQPKSENPTSWIADPNLVGTQGILAQSGMEMTNMNADMLVAGSVPLTRALMSKVDLGLIGSLLQPIIAPFLTQSLTWRVQGPDGTSVDPSTIPNFEVSVIASTSTQPASADALPAWSIPTVLDGVTQGKAGGLGSTNQAQSRMR
ncbi:MAG: hypothetical protein M1820_009958 [Bogoriella megaspora]|nr:MAG: hypothetical protein M1820_009958 [Bogoriella megaspora]